MSGELHIIVATVAFGMGIDKSNVRAVIHMSIPQNLESYIQEMGRAGRDGLPAYCHLFVDNNDFLEMRALLQSQSTEMLGIRKIVASLFAI